MVEPRLFYEKVWGGVAIEDGGLDDEEAAEDLDGDYGNEREGEKGRPTNWALWRWGMDA